MSAKAPPQTPLEKLTELPRPLDLMGPTSKGRERQAKREKGRKGNLKKRKGKTRRIRKKK